MAASLVELSSAKYPPLVFSISIIDAFIKLEYSASLELTELLYLSYSFSKAAFSSS